MTSSELQTYPDIMDSLKKFQEYYSEQLRLLWIYESRISHYIIINSAHLNYPKNPSCITIWRPFSGTPLPFGIGNSCKVSDFRQFQESESVKTWVFCFTLKRRFWKMMPDFGRLSHRSYLLSKSANLSLQFYKTVTPVCHPTLSLHLSLQLSKLPFLIVLGHKNRA